MQYNIYDNLKYIKYKRQNLIPHISQQLTQKKEISKQMNE